MPNIYDVTTETLREDVIDLVALHDSLTAREIADVLEWYYEDICELLAQLRREGLVCNLAGEETDDLIVDHEGCEFIIEVVHWRWCGGPISEALRVA